MRYLEVERRASPHTRAAYRRDLLALAEFAAERQGGERVDRLDVYLLRAWLGQLARRHAPSSVARKIAATKSWMRWLRRRGHIKKSSADELASPKVRRPLPTFLSVDAAAEVVET